MALNKPVDEISEDDLQALVIDKVAEKKTIEYKDALPSNAESEKIKFLAQVSSFANTIGGHLIYGIYAENGVPKELRGLQADKDATILSLRHSISNGLAPALRGVEIQDVDLPSKPGRWAMVVRIRKSWAAPHMVTLQDHGKFYVRDERGKRAIKIDELRAAFDLSGTTAERIRNFRANRLMQIISGETPALLDEKAPKLVFHIIPFSTFDPASKFDLGLLAEPTNNSLIKPITAFTNMGISAPRYNFDGLLSHTMPGRETPGIVSYVQVFRNGSVEAVDTTILTYSYPQKGILGRPFDQKLLDSLLRYLGTQKKLGVEPPLFVLVSLLGVKGFHIIPETIDIRDVAYPIDRDDLIIPEAVVEQFDCNATEAIKPILDTIWNAAGWGRSMSYDEAGNWRHT